MWFFILKQPAARASFPSSAAPSRIPHLNIVTWTGVQRCYVLSRREPGFRGVRQRLGYPSVVAIHTSLSVDKVIQSIDLSVACIENLTETWRTKRTLLLSSPILLFFRCCTLLRAVPMGRKPRKRVQSRVEIDPVLEAKSSSYCHTRGKFIYSVRARPMRGKWGNMTNLEAVCSGSRFDGDLESKCFLFWRHWRMCSCTFCM